MATIKVNFRPASEAGRPGAVFYRIYHRNQIRQLAAGYSLSQSQWEAMNVNAGDSCGRQDSDSIFRKIAFDKERFTRIISAFEASPHNYTADDIINEFVIYSHRSTLTKFIEKIAARLYNMGKIRTSETYMSAMRSFSKFCSGEQIPLDHIHAGTMELYQGWLLEQGIMLNSVSFYARILRAVYNRAVEQGLTPDRHPFRHIYTGIDKTVKELFRFPQSVRSKILTFRAFRHLTWLVIFSL